jgi:hypothetical protein
MEEHLHRGLLCSVQAHVKGISVQGQCSVGGRTIHKEPITTIFSVIERMYTIHALIYKVRILHSSQNDAHT